MALVIAASASVAVADEWAALPSEVRTAPLGVGWALPYVPITPELVRIVRVVLYAACASGALGLFSRASFAIASACLLYVLLPPQLGGAVFHDHHLIWFAILLAFSPCGDALSVDVWLERRRGRSVPTHGRAHWAAIRVAWILVGLIFLFPGVHKLAESGLEWITSDNLRNQLWWKWAQDPSLQPSLRIDRHPILLRALAGATVVFELAFLPLVLWRRTRALVVISALIFHQATDYFMGVRFTVLLACYGMFVPWHAWLERLRGARPRIATPGRSLVPVAVAGVLLVVPVASAGVMGAMQAYPFACYPTFQWIAADRMPALAIEVERADGTRAWLDRALYVEPGPRGWALEWRLAGVYGPVQPAALEAWWRDVSRRPSLASAIRDARTVRFYRASVSVDPDRRGEILERRAIYTR